MEFFLITVGFLILVVALVFGLSLVVGGAISIIRGWVLSVLWGWFIVPTFNMPVLEVVPAIGIMVTLTFLFQHRMVSEISKKVVLFKGPKTKALEAANLAKERANLSPEEVLQKDALEKERSKSEFKTKVVEIILFALNPFLSLFFGWIIHLFM